MDLHQEAERSDADKHIERVRARALELLEKDLAKKMRKTAAKEGYYPWLGEEEQQNPQASVISTAWRRERRRMRTSFPIQRSLADPAEGSAMTDEIAIRPYALEDAPRLFEAARESIAEVYPWLPWCRPEYSLAEAEDWVAKQVQLYSERAVFPFAVVSASGRHLGGCGLNQIDPIHRRANLGYWVRTSATRQGTASRAVRLLADWAFGNTDLVRLEIVVAVANQASLRVAEKAGAIREGVARSRLLLHRASHDAVVFSIVRGDSTSESPLPPVRQCP